MSEHEFERKVADALKRDAEAIDPMIRRRLAAARQDAVDLLGERRPLADAVAGWLSPPRVMVPAASLAAVMVAVFGARVLMTEPQALPPALTALDDIDIVLAEEELELYEDLDFYLWVEFEASGQLADEA